MPRALPGGFVIPDWLRRDLALAPADAFARAGVSDYRYSIRGVASRQGFHQVAFREQQRPAEGVLGRAVLRLDPFERGP